MVVESMNGEVFLRVARSAGLGPLYAHMVKAVPSSNLSNSGNVSYSCELLVDNENLKDGKIPQVLGLALGAWLALTLVFLLLRCFASDYSRAGMATSSQYEETVSAHSKLMDGGRKDRSLSLSTMMYEDKHWYTWFYNFFYRIRNSDVQHRCGPDATLYLSLHVHIIVLLCVLMVLSLVVILPVNYLAGNLESDGGFPQTTISNIDPRSGVLWVHTLFTLVFLAITGVFMVHYSLQLGKTQEELSHHSAMVQWIPSVVHREDILQHLQEGLPNSSVTDVQMAYDVSRLVKLNKKLTTVKDNLMEVESVKNDLGIEETVRVGWRKPFFCVDSYNLDAKLYYDEQFEKLTREIETEKEEVKQGKRLGVGFVTFGREEDAKTFCDSYRLGHTRPRSSVYDDVNARWWWVSSAPFPLDIIWENLSIHYLSWWVRWCVINAVLLLFVFFFTTPAILLSSVDQIRLYLANITHLPDIDQQQVINTTYTDPLVKILLPNLMLLLFASLLPYCVSRSSFLEAHWTRSFREQTIMRKTYLFLLLMIIILPAVGLASLNALAELTVGENFEDVLKDRLKCVFLPNNGAFFVGYLITTAFIGTGVKLLRVPELLQYMLRRCQAKTRLQRELALQKAAAYEFMYGVEYAWNLVVFNMVMSFSLTTPLIVPFGVVYFILNYYVDKYNIYYVYSPAPYNGRQFLHRSAVNFVIVGAVQMQLLFLFFSVIRLGQVDPRTVIMIVTFVLTCCVCIGVMFLGWFRHLLPQLRVKLGKEYAMFSSGQGERLLGSTNYSEEVEEAVAKGAYIPPVLRETSPLDSSKVQSHGSFGYHSFGNTDHMGRRSTHHTPGQSPTSLSPSLQPPTMERGGGSKASGGAGPTGTLKDQAQGSQPKSFV